MSKSRIFTGVCYVFDIVFELFEIIIKLLYSLILSPVNKYINNNKTKVNIMLIRESAFINNFINDDRKVVYYRIYQCILWSI